jgi:hypothetical protein
LLNFWQNYFDSGNYENKQLPETDEHLRQRKSIPLPAFPDRSRDLFIFMVSVAENQIGELLLGHLIIP